LQFYNRVNKDVCWLTPDKVACRSVAVFLGKTLKAIPHLGDKQSTHRVGGPTWQKTCKQKHFVLKWFDRYRA